MVFRWRVSKNSSDGFDHKQKIFRDSNFTASVAKAEEYIPRNTRL